MCFGPEPRASISFKDVHGAGVRAARRTDYKPVVVQVKRMPEPITWLRFGSLQHIVEHPCVGLILFKDIDFAGIDRTSIANHDYIVAGNDSTSKAQA